MDAGETTETETHETYQVYLRVVVVVAVPLCHLKLVSIHINKSLEKNIQILERIIVTEMISLKVSRFDDSFYEVLRNSINLKV